MQWYTGSNDRIAGAGSANAANGDDSEFGDFIYSDSVRTGQADPRK